MEEVFIKVGEGNEETLEHRYCVCAYVCAYMGGYVYTLCADTVWVDIFVGILISWFSRSLCISRNFSHSKFKFNI